MTQSIWFIGLTLAFGMGLAYFIFFMTQPSHQAGTLLEQAYRSGQITDPIQALIFVEKLQEKPIFNFWGGVLAALVSFGAAPTAFWGTGKLLKWMLPSYNFYWGDYVAEFDKRKNILWVFWTVIVLGIIVSVISGVILKYIP
jgi:hypothetical protein